MITPEQIEEDEKLCTAATEGPFSHFGGAVLKDGAVVAECAAPEILLKEWAENAVFFARARTALPEYIAEVERLRAVLAFLSRTKATEDDFREYARVAITQQKG